MAMQRSPLLMSRLLDRAARISPNSEIVTATETGVRPQSANEVRERAHQCQPYRETPARWAPVALGTRGAAAVVSTTQKKHSRHRDNQKAMYAWADGRQAVQGDDGAF